MTDKTKEAVDGILNLVDKQIVTREAALAKICAIVEAERAGPTPMYLKAQKLIWDEAIKEHQKLYRENQRLQCEIARLSKTDKDNFKSSKGEK